MFGSAMQCKAPAGQALLLTRQCSQGLGRKLGNLDTGRGLGRTDGMPAGAALALQVAHLRLPSLPFLWPLLLRVGVNLRACLKSIPERG